MSPAVEAAPVVFVTVPQAAGVNVNEVSSKVKPAGKLSSTCTVVSAVVVLGFANVSVSVVLPPTCMADPPNAFEMVGGTTPT